MDARAECEWPGAGGLGRLRRVRLEVLELLDDAESRLGRLDAADRLVARLLVVAPRPGLAAHRQGRDALDDGVVGIHVAVEAADFSVGDDVEPRALHVADGGVGGVVEHLVEVAGAVLAGLDLLDGGEPPPGLAVGADDGGRNEGKSGHYTFPPVTRSAAASFRTSSGLPAKMISPRS